MPIPITTSYDVLNQAAAHLIYAVSGVFEIRRQDTPRGVTFWVQGDCFSDNDLRQFSRIERHLFRSYPQYRTLLEIDELYSRPPLHSSFWESLPIVHTSTFNGDV